MVLIHVDQPEGTLASQHLRSEHGRIDTVMKRERDPETLFARNERNAQNGTTGSWAEILME